MEKLRIEKDFRRRNFKELFSVSFWTQPNFHETEKLCFAAIPKKNGRKKNTHNKRQQQKGNGYTTAT